jgi:hypothetical protein
MNCAKIASLTRWECSPSGSESVRAIAPITLGEGGQHIAFYIAQPSPDTFYLTDACEIAMYAEQIGVSLTKSRLELLNRTPGVELAEFQSDWSIEASGSVNHLQLALWDAVKLALALSFKSHAWRPKFAQAKFQAIVLQELEAELGAERIIRQARVQGASGHMIDFPMGIRRPEGGLVYVQPVALDNGKINWPSIYEFHGKLFDVKAASEIDNRIAIIESGAPAIEFGRAANFLAHAASVFTLDDLPGLAKTFHAS